METNENNTNTITAQKTENAQIKVNIQPSVESVEEINTKPVIAKKMQNSVNIDEQATQRIEFLSELIKDTEISQKENLEAKINGQYNNNEKKKEILENNVAIIENEKVVNANKQDESKEKQHSQDKKDYRLEKLLLDRINAMQGKIKESLELIKKFERINAKEENLPNIVTTLRDKLTLEVIKQFRTVGIEFNMKSYLVQAVVSDLLGTFEEGITEFKECSENLNFVKEVQDDFESRIELAPTSKVKNMFARLRGLFKPERKQERLIDLERARQEKKLEEANIHLIKYKYKNSELEKYTIRKNIVDSLTREMLYGKNNASVSTVNELIEKRITPELEKLGLQYQVENLENALFKEYSQKCKVDSKEEFMNIHLRDAKNNIKFNLTDGVQSKIVMAVPTKVAEHEELAI